VRMSSSLPFQLKNKSRYELEHHVNPLVVFHAKPAVTTNTNI